MNIQVIIFACIFLISLHIYLFTGHFHTPTYVLEHLATFTVSPENDLVYPADGMRRLLAMEKTNGIWTQKMLMKVDAKSMGVNIIDQENKEIVERFPLDLVREPTAFTSNDPKELYNNILIYIVGHPPEESPTPAEMHIFQCNNVRARDVVEDLKSYMAGGHGTSRHRGRHTSPEFPDVKVGDLAPYDAEGGSMNGGRDHRLQAQLETSGKRAADDETSSTSSEKYERDVAVLNRCFDDIEKFIARLQHAAAAFRELDKRRRSRKGSKKKDLGDGMLSMRAKPPPEREFVDIFQKFKLSFNLLAKLKAHIHDPNAPELVHFLFTPLALIVDASHDSHYGPNLPSKVLEPLLSADAVDLLINCLTSKESELWHSLGETWYVPSEEWKGHVPPYRPVFMDGWSPVVMPFSEGTDPHNPIDEREDYDDRPGSSSAHNYHGSYDETDTRRTPSRPIYPERPQHNEMVDDGDTSADDGRFDQRAWAEDLFAQGKRAVRVTYPRTANNEKELTVVRGELLEVLDDSRKWWKTRNQQGQVGHVPHTIVSPYEPSQRGRRY